MHRIVHKVATLCAAAILLSMAACTTPANAATGTPDLLWFNPTTGELSAWLLDGHGKVLGKQPLSWQCSTSSGCSSSWHTVGIGDLNSDGHPDLLWFNPTTGELSAWLLDGHGNV